MRKLFAWLMLLAGISCAPAHAQWDAIFNSVAPVAGVGRASVLTYTGTGLSLAQPLSTADTLSNEYGITLPRYFNNTAQVSMRPEATKATLGCFGTCFF